MSSHRATDGPAVERVHPPDLLMRLVNPVVRRLVARGRPRKLAEQLVVLHFPGRRSGKAYSIPAGRREIRGREAVLTNSGWRFNFRGGRDIELTWKGRRQAAHASLTEDPDEVAAIYAELIDAAGSRRAGRELGIRINVERVPTREELRSLVERSGLSVVWLERQAAAP